ncbi:ExeM/NucH family extracellular endonuclease [uncultured Marinobacter sp.]|uniref:ExeM/NucH family extracellular endonuclease n=1 Tax=uncultured Marinobacter sp. TaxID=187379 RepID=UPI0030DC2BC7
MTRALLPLLFLVMTVVPSLHSSIAIAECGAPATPVSTIQSTPHLTAGQQVTVEGVMTLDLRKPGGFDGFYLQQADDQTDRDPTTSEAIFVHTQKTSASRGQRTRVTGIVHQHYGLTSLTRISELSPCGAAPLPRPVPISLPWPGDQSPRQLESMRVTLNHPLVVTDTYNLGRYGELVLAPAVQPIPTQVLRPGPDAVALFETQNQQRLLLDDGLRKQHPRPVPYPPPGLSGSRTVRTGGRVETLTGVLDYRFGHWRIQPEAPPVFSHHDLRQPPPGRASGSNLRVMSLNLENYFNGDGKGQGFPATRGARARAQFDAQTARLVSAVRQADPDVLTVMELENDDDGPYGALVTLARALGEDWGFIESAALAGTDAIRVAILYRTDRLAPTGSPAGLLSGPFQRGNRPPLAQSFRRQGQPESLRVVAVHLKSKSCRNARTPEQDQHDGQGCFAPLRTEAAAALAAWLKALPIPAGHQGTLITGDLNSYAMEPPLTLLADRGYQDLVRAQHGKTTTSFRFHGRSGTLDYHLADPALLPRVKQAFLWGINAEEPRVLSALENKPASGDQSANTPWRSSDHNPVISDIAL